MLLLLRHNRVHDRLQAQNAKGTHATSHSPCSAIIAGTAGVNVFFQCMSLLEHFVKHNQLDLSISFNAFHCPKLQVPPTRRPADHAQELKDQG